MSGFADIKDLITNCNTSGDIAEYNLTSWYGRCVNLLHNWNEELPDWAISHLHNERLLSCAIQEIKSSGQEIPKEAESALEAARKVTWLIANKASIQAFSRAVKPHLEDLHFHGLISGDTTELQEIAPATHQWLLNLALLSNVHRMTKNPDTKKKIEFLIFHYLANAAPVNLRAIIVEPFAEIEKTENLFQCGVMNLFGSYHRENPFFEKYLKEYFDEKMPIEKCRPIYLVDDVNCQELFSLFFQVGLISENDEIYEKVIMDAINQHYEKYGEKFFQVPCDKLMLLDLTGVLAEDLITGMDDKKKEKYFKKKELEKTRINAKIDKIVDSLANNGHPLLKTVDGREKLKGFLKMSMLFISRSEVSGVGFIKEIGMFDKSEDFGAQDVEVLGGVGRSKINLAQSMSATAMGLFLSETGIRLGGVSGREKIFNILNIEDLIAAISLSQKFSLPQYSVQGANIEYYPSASSILESHLFSEFKKVMLSKEFPGYRVLEDSDLSLEENQSLSNPSFPAFKVLGEAAVKIIEGLLSKINDERWREIKENPELRMIFQQSLHRLMLSLADARNAYQSNNFTKFTNAMEIVFSEISSILSISSPYEKKDFEVIYKKYLNIVPENFHKYVRVGLGKSAMNVFAGANVALGTMVASPQKTCREDTYYEEFGFIGKENTIDKMNGKKVDLYAGDFHHNINVRASHTNYIKEDIIQDIKGIMPASPISKDFHLTVTIDCTIDFVNSEDCRKLLEAFTNELQDGNINFVFFRSGQKFDMLGFDNYYGAPFWIVNNGNEVWKSFEHLCESSLYTTDLLTHQWFCLLYEFSPESPDEYKRIIFNNAREILNNIPQELQSGLNSQLVRVSSANQDVNSPFIDIKVFGPNCSELASRLQKNLNAKFINAGRKIYERDSFGFYHPNINSIPGESGLSKNINLRLNPGIDPEENKLIIEFIKEIPAILQSTDI